MTEFDALHFTESTFGTSMLIGSDLLVPIRGVVPVDEPLRSLSGRLIFKGAQRSVRRVAEYIGDPRQPVGFKNPYIAEQQFAPASEDAREYAFEGVQTDPRAWVDWVITAKSFEFIEDSAD
jgi:hypothetical protein